ncbi:MAG: hypothetical protein AVDCRST_MAG41-2068, partial [uncultured Corynebacteriales bacterium]
MSQSETAPGLPGAERVLDRTAEVAVEVDAHGVDRAESASAGGPVEVTGDPAGAA